MWEVRWTARSVKDLRKLDQPTRRRIVAATERFAESGAGKVLQLTGIRPPEWRLRVGMWRIRFQKDPGGPAIVVLRVLPRDKAYPG